MIIYPAVNNNKKKRVLNVGRLDCCARMVFLTNRKFWEQHHFLKKTVQRARIVRVVNYYYYYNYFTHNKMVQYIYKRDYYICTCRTYI